MTEDRYSFRLYVAGRSTRSERAVENLRRICDAWLPDHYDLVVVDVLDQPEVAEREHVIATPTLVREAPRPVRRLVGDLSDAEVVLAGLDLQTGDRR